MNIYLTSEYTKNYKKYTKNKPKLKAKIKETILLLEQNHNSPQLKTHKLKGKFSTFLSCSCGYDCRIIFDIELVDNKKALVLYDIGKHDDVY